jgi:hypothetical protein
MNLEEIGSAILANIKLKLSIAANSDEAIEEDPQDDLLEALCKDAYQYMCIFFDCDPKSTDKSKKYPPIQLQCVLENVVVKRYRKLGAEGISIEKIDVLSTTYESGDDFAEYFDIMQKYKNKYRLGFRFF